MWFMLALAVFLPVGVGFWAMKRGFASASPLAEKLDGRKLGV
jgi:hypothetical protein